MRERLLVVGLRSTVAVGAVLSVAASAALLIGGYAEAWFVGFSVHLFVVTTCFAGFVWFVAPSQPRNPVVWTMAVTALVGIWLAGKAAAALFFPEGWALPDQVELNALGVAPAQLPEAAAWLHLLTGWAVFPALLAPMTLGLLLFPDGSLPSARWRPVAWLGGTALVLVAVGGLWDYRISSTIPPEDGTVLNIGFLIGMAVAVASIVALVRRLRRSHGAMRQQIKWVLWGTSAFGLTIALGYVIGRTPLEYLLHIAFGITAVALPVSYGMALGRYRLYDIDLVINRTLVFASLAVFITAFYSLVVVVLGGLIGGASLWWSIAATAIVAVAFEPVRSAVQRRVNRLIYGSRATPYEVLGELTRRLSSVEGTEGLLGRMADQLAAGTGADRAAVWLAAGDTLTVAAVAPAAAERPGSPQGFVADIVLDGARLGALSVEKRRGDPLTRQEQRLTTALAAAAAPVLQRVRLDADLAARAAELARSRARLLDAQDAEQGRLRRSLEGGIRSTIVSLHSRLADLADTAGAGGSPAAQQLIEGVAADAAAAIEQIDAVSRGMYPAVLEAEGLGPALGALAAAAPLEVELRTDRIDGVDLPVAAGVYFTVSEALTNAAKHAVGPVRVDAAGSGDRIVLTVADSGPGFDPVAIDRGSGLANMEERMRLLGGELRIESAPGRSTVVAASVPVSMPVGAPAA